MKSIHVRYMIALCCIVIGWTTFGAAATITAALFVEAIPALPLPREVLEMGRAVTDYVLMQVQFLCLFGSIVLAVGLILKSRVRDIVRLPDSGRPFSPHRAIGAALVWCMVIGVSALIEYLIFPEAYILNPLGPAGLQGGHNISVSLVTIGIWLGFLAVALVLTPIQTSAEELLFRVLPARWFGTMTSNRLLLSLVSGLLFLLVHLRNPEVRANQDAWSIYLYYALFGALAMYLSLRDGGFEIAFGVHAGNNLFAALFINYAGSAMPTPSLLVVNRFDPRASLLVMLCGFAIIVALFQPPPRTVQGR